MIREIVESKCNIQFDYEMMEKFGVHPDIPTLDHPSMSLKVANALMHRPQAKSSIEQPEPSEQDKAADSVDALRPIHDELVLMPLWWILEVIPLPFRWQDRFGKWHEKWELHLGRGRYKNKTDPILFHETVRIRMTEKKYKPWLHYRPGEEQYVW